VISSNLNILPPLRFRQIDYGFSFAALGFGFGSHDLSPSYKSWFDG
jgi:hypothetical protein